MTPDAFLDTNVVLRHLLQDLPDQSLRASALIVEIEQGNLTVRMTETVVFETVFTLEKGYKASRAGIARALQPILELPGVVLPGKRIFPEVFGLWAQNPGLSFADCFHLCFAKQQEIPVMLSFDRKMNRLPGVVLREP